MLKLKTAIALLIVLTVCSVTARAEEFKGEIVEMGGSSKLSRAGKLQNLAKGTLVQTGDTIDVNSGSTLSIALDGDMENVVHLTGPTSIKVESFYPTVLTLNKGDLLAKLEALPTNSSFEVETPVGVAAARGTEFRTVYKDAGLEVFNLSKSDVYVFNKEAGGKIAAKPVIVPQAQKTAVKRAGVAPTAPQKMADIEMRDQRRVQDKLSENMRAAQGHKPQLPPIAQIHKDYKNNMQTYGAKGGTGLVSREDGQGKDPRAAAFQRQAKFFEGVRATRPESSRAQTGAADAEKRPGFQPEKRPGFNPEERPGFNPEKRPGFKPGDGLSLQKDKDQKPGQAPERRVYLPKMGEHRPASPQSPAPYGQTPYDSRVADKPQFTGEQPAFTRPQPVGTDRQTQPQPLQQQTQATQQTQTIQQTQAVRQPSTTQQTQVVQQPQTTQQTQAVQQQPKPVETQTTDANK